jgi:hypothetical protein
MHRLSSDLIEEFGAVSIVQGCRKCGSPTSLVLLVQVTFNNVLVLRIKYFISLKLSKEFVSQN